jgi:hypothetical protein
MEAARHYTCQLRLDGEMAFVVWYSGERDGFLRDAGGRLLTACTLEALAAAAQARGIGLEDAEPSIYDFDRINTWCAAPNAAGVDCQAFLDAWNLFDDLAGLHTGADNPYARLSRETAGCYDRLFWGNNLPTVTPPGEQFEPVWSAEELIEIRRVLAAGLVLLATELPRRGAAEPAL